MFDERELREYYEMGWELPLLSLCDARRLRRSTFKFRILPVVDEVRTCAAGGCDILDVGCGVALTSVLIARRHPTARFHCIDISNKQIEAARQYVREAGIADRFTFSVTDISRTLETPSPRYDYVICSEVIEHLVDPDALLRSLRSAGDGGTRYLVTVPLGGGEERTVSYRVIGDDGSNVVVDVPPESGGRRRCYPFYHRRYTMREAEALLDRNGYAIERIVPYNFLHAHPLKRYLNRLTGYSRAFDRLMNAATGARFAEGVLLVCRR